MLNDKLRMIAADLVSVFKQDGFNVIFVVLRVVLVGVLHIITYVKFPGLVGFISRVALSCKPRRHLLVCTRLTFGFKRKYFSADPHWKYFTPIFYPQQCLHFHKT